MLSLETCEKLKAAGFNQNTLLCWQRKGDKWHDINLTSAVFPTKGENLAACPTLEELLEEVEKMDRGNGFVVGRGDSGWFTSMYPRLGKSLMIEHFNPSEAVADLWLRLNEVKPL